MSFFIPTYYFNKLTDINIELLKKYSITTILLDVDNTISPPDSLELFDGVMDWIANVKAQNTRILITSNNYKKRVKPISQIVDVDFVYLSLKPLTFRVKNFLKTKKIKRSETLIIGDQIFSDILFANFLGIKSILLNPQAAENNRFTIRLKRYIESFIKCKFLKIKE